MNAIHRKHTRVKLTKRSVEATKPGPGRDVVIWDSEIPGFGLRVWPSGRRVYVLKYRTAEGRQRKVTIGQHGAITAEQARKIAQRWRGDGGDPAGEKYAARNAPNISDLAERYLAEHAAVKKRPRSIRSDETLLRLHVRRQNISDSWRVNLREDSGSRGLVFRLRSSADAGDDVVGSFFV